MGREGRAKEGKFSCGGLSPIGYDYIDGLLQVNEYEAMQIREIHRLFQSGYSLKEITRVMKQKGFSHKYGLWHENRVKKCLKNDVYIGNVHYKNKVFEGLQEPLIDVDSYKKTLSIFESKDNSKCNNRGKLYYLSGLMYCKQCGARFTASVYTRNGRTYKYYMCHSRRKANVNMVKNPNCKNKSWRMDELDNLIFDEISKLALDPSHIHEMKLQDNENIKKANLLRAEIGKINNQRKRLMDLYGLGTFTVDEIQSKVEPLNEQRKRLEDEIFLLETDNGLSEDDALDYLSQWDDVLQNGHFEQVRALINAMIEKIEIDGDDVTIHWRFT